MHEVSQRNGDLIPYQCDFEKKVSFNKSEKTIQKIAGDLFIVPIEAIWIDIIEQEKLIRSGQDANAVGDYINLFFPHRVEILSLHVWAASAESRDWSRHVPASGKAYRFPLFLPMRYLFNKKEGDALHISSEEKNHLLLLTCCQLGYRYHSYGPFETIVEEKFMAAYNDLHDRYIRGMLSQKEQRRWEVMSHMKQEFYPDSTVATRHKRCHL